MENAESSSRDSLHGGSASPAIQKTKKKVRKMNVKKRKTNEDDVSSSANGNATVNSNSVSHPPLKRAKNIDKFSASACTNSSFNANSGSNASNNGTASGLTKKAKKKKAAALSGSAEKFRPSGSSTGSSGKQQKEGNSEREQLSDRKPAKYHKKPKKLSSGVKSDKAVAREKERRTEEEHVASISPSGTGGGQRIDPEIAERNQAMRDALKEERFSLLGSVKNISDSEASDRDEDDVCHGRPSSRKSTKVGSKNKTGSMSVPNKIQSGLVGSMSASASASIDEEEREVRAMTESIRNGVKRISNAHIPFAGQAVRLIEEFNGRMSPFFSRSSEDRFSKSSSKNIRRPDHVIGNESVEDEEGSLFGQSNGASNVWVQCDRCAKWRRLRGAVDSKKLPSKWFCTMNKSDPERARCSAPEEEYHDVPESAEENRTRKHLRLWVRRLKGYEAYEAKMPTMTRGKKKSVTIGSKEPYEWVRCCNPSCGKWRAILRFMDASDIMESTRDKDWYCVLNTWDEKTASCSAPQENLPATGCPPWVMKDEK